MLAAVALVATVVLAAQTWHKAFRTDGNDLTSYLLSARALWNGRSPYGLPTPFPYIYPLFLAFAMIPLAVLPYGVAVVGWFAASIAALAAILRRFGSGSALAIAAAVVVAFGVIQNNLLNGQVNFLVVLCCVLSIAAAQKKRETGSGLWLGAGIALKLMPAVLLVYLVVRRQFRALAVAAVSALIFALLPALLLDGSGGVESGFSRITEAYSQFMRELQSSVEGGPALTYSISGHVQRVTGVSASLPLDALCAAVVVGILAVIDVRMWRPRRQHLAAAAAYMAAIVLISPKSETHHLAFAIPAIALCFAWWFETRPQFSEPSALALLGAAVALVAAPFIGAAEGPAITAATLMLVAALIPVAEDVESRR